MIILIFYILIFTGNIMNKLPKILVLSLVLIGATTVSFAKDNLNKENMADSEKKIKLAILQSIYYRI